jgi:hypothetical protein
MARDSPSALPVSLWSGPPCTNSVARPDSALVVAPLTLPSRYTREVPPALTAASWMLPSSCTVEVLRGGEGQAGGGGEAWGEGQAGLVSVQHQHVRLSVLGPNLPPVWMCWLGQAC